MNKRFGDTVKVEYHDLASDAERQKYPEVAQMIDTNTAPVPLVAVDGEVKMAGRVDYWSIVELVEAKNKSAEQ